MAKYLKDDSELGYIVDNALIEYSKFNNMRHTVLGYMLGDYDETGEYVVSEEIKQELISMRKYIVDTVDNIDVCHSELKLDKQISFFVTFESDRAILSLVEKVSFQANNQLNSGIYSNIVETVIDMVETSGVVNKNAIYRRWNIGSFSGSVLDVFQMDDDTIAELFGIVNRFKYLLAANEILLKNEHEIEEIEAEYANTILEILEHYPKLKKVVEQEIKKTLTEQSDFIKLDKPNAAKTLNEIINQAIEDNIDVLDEKEQEEFKVEKHNAVNTYNIKVQDAVPVKVEKAPAEKKGEDIVLPKIDTNRRDEVTPLEDLADSFVKTAKETESRVADDVVEIITGKPVVRERDEDKKELTPDTANKDKDDKKELETTPNETETAPTNKKPIGEERKKLFGTVAAIVVGATAGTIIGQLTNGNKFAKILTTATVTAVAVATAKINKDDKNTKTQTGTYTENPVNKDKSNQTNKQDTPNKSKTTKSNNKSSGKGSSSSNSGKGKGQEKPANKTVSNGGNTHTSSGTSIIGRMTETAEYGNNRSAATGNGNKNPKNNPKTKTEDTRKKIHVDMRNVHLDKGGELRRVDDMNNLKNKDGEQVEGQEILNVNVAKKVENNLTGKGYKEKLVKQGNQLNIGDDSRIVSSNILNNGDGI